MIAPAKSGMQGWEGQSLKTKLAVDLLTNNCVNRLRLPLVQPSVKGMGRVGVSG